MQGDFLCYCLKGWVIGLLLEVGFLDSYPIVIFPALIGYWGQISCGAYTERRPALGEHEESGLEQV